MTPTEVLTPTELADVIQDNLLWGTAGVYGQGAVLYDQTGKSAATPASDAQAPTPAISQQLGVNVADTKAPNSAVRVPTAPQQTDVAQAPAASAVPSLGAAVAPTAALQGSVLPTPTVVAPPLSAVPDLGAVNVQGMVPNISLPNVSSAAPNSGQVAPAVGKVLPADSSLLPGITGTTLSDIKAPSLGVVPDVGRSQVAVAGTPQGFKQDQDAFSLFATVAEGSGKPGAPPKTPTSNRGAVAKVRDAAQTTKPVVVAMIGSSAVATQGGVSALPLIGPALAAFASDVAVAFAGIALPLYILGGGMTDDGMLNYTEEDKQRQAAAAAAAGAAAIGIAVATGGAPNPLDPNDPRNKQSNGNPSKNDCKNSFDPSTLVRTLGGLVTIASLTLGTQVLAYNEQTGKNQYDPITHIFKNVDPAITYLTLKDGKTGEPEAVTTTPEHPFYVQVQAGTQLRPKPVGHEELNPRWVGAGHLQIGDKIKQADGVVGVVANVVTVAQMQEMFNLTVDEAHTFYVGEKGWLVHNTSCPVNDYATAETKNYSGWYKSEGEARAIARTKIGSDPIEVSPGKWRSQDGRWQYRAKPGDVADNHIHLEQLNPKTGEVRQNLHLRWQNGTGR